VSRKIGNDMSRIFSFPGGRRFHFLDPSGNELAVWSDIADPSARSVLPDSCLVNRDDSPK
jgi:hypothetical protein